MKGNLGKIMLVLVFLVLAGNLLALSGKMSEPSGDVDVYLVATVFLALLAGNGFVGVAGVVLTTRAHEKHEKSSLLWMRRAFVIALVETGLMAAGPWLFVPGHLAPASRMFSMCLVLFPFGILTGTFAMAAWREHARAVGRGSRPRDSGRDQGGHGPPARS